MSIGLISTFLNIIFPHYNFIISQLWLTSHPRNTVVLLDTGTSGASREIFSEDADDRTRTRNPLITKQTECSSHWAVQLKSYCWEGVEFIQLVYCIIFLSFLNCDRLLIREVQWFYWTQKLLVPAEKFSVNFWKFLYWYQECPVEPLYFSDEKSITVEKW